MIFIEFLADMIGGVLDALGGYHWLFARRYIMPFVLGVGVSVISHVWWLGVLCFPAMGTFTLGYPLEGKNAGRALWLFIQAIALSLGLAVFNHIAINLDWWFIHVHNRWVLFALYIVLAGVLGGIYKNWQQKIGDLATGMYLGLILFFVR